MLRYQQQKILPEIGDVGQQKIGSASVLIIGAGGLGVVVASYLAAMGLGKIGICDFDTVQETNLHRQFTYSDSEIGKLKASILVQKISQQNPSIDIRALNEESTPENLPRIARDYQFICDCTDQSFSRICIDAYCKQEQKPLIHGAVSDWQGYVSVFHYRKQIELSDVFEKSSYLKSQSCGISGINSATCGIIGSYMVNECIKIILNSEDILDGKILYVDTWKNVFRILKIKKAHR